MSAVDICNIGLSKYLGIPSISNLNEATPQAEQCAIHYNNERKSLLLNHNWNFARMRQNLALVENDRTTFWNYKYQKPSNCLKLYWVNQIDNASILGHRNLDKSCNYELFNNFIYTNLENVSAEFTQDIENTDEMPHSFKTALSAHVAAAVAQSLTQNERKQANIMQIAQHLSELAIQDDMRQQPINRSSRSEAEAIQARTVPIAYWS